MSISTAHDRDASAVPGVDQLKSRSVLGDWVVVFIFAAGTSVAMIGWLYLLGLALWNGASWLMS
jgi:hypothetical protein